MSRRCMWPWLGTALMLAGPPAIPAAAQTQEPPEVQRDSVNDFAPGASKACSVPFRILTDEEDRLLDKNYKDTEKQMDDAFKREN
jgi:hypothetical protein